MKIAYVPAMDGTLDYISNHNTFGAEYIFGFSKSVYFSYASACTTRFGN